MHDMLSAPPSAEDLRAEVERLRLLHSISLEFSASLDFDELLPRVFQRVLTVLGDDVAPTPTRRCAALTLAQERQCGRNEGVDRWVSTASAKYRCDATFRAWSCKTQCDRTLPRANACREPRYRLCPRPTIGSATPLFAGSIPAGASRCRNESEH